MSFEISVSPEAQKTFIAIVEQLEDRWGQKIVNEFKTKVEKTISSLSKDPYRYPVYHEPTGLRWCILHKNHSMLYSINGNEVYIAIFWDNRQDPIFLP